MENEEVALEKMRVRGVGRTTRGDWIQIALDTLISEGISSVKVLTLAKKLDCARSSFYWYFKNRSDLLDSLLDHWQSTNTRAIVKSAGKSAATINLAVCNVFSVWVGEKEFDTHLDFAIRDWARRSGTVRRALDVSDAIRLDALSSMFGRHGYSDSEAEVRAQIMYLTQIGYDFLDQRENLETRIGRGCEYLFCMTAQRPTDVEIEALGRLVPDADN